MKVALVHDWLVGMRGGERVLEALLDLFPTAEIFTLFHRPGSTSPAIEARPIHTSFLDRLPGARRAYRHLLPLFPRAVESLDVRGFDLVVSSSHCVAKGVRVPAGTPHLCYCHTPMRYLWDQYDAYFARGRASVPVRLAMRAVAPRLRAWDVRTARGVDRFVANSTAVRERIRRIYRRDASVVHPPVDVERFHATGERDGPYLVLGALQPYKRVDLAVEAFRGLDRPLVVVGGGRVPRAMRARAGNRVAFLGHLPDQDVSRILARARALILPGVEDFGIGVVEALASGTPVIALGEGGALDTVRPAACEAGSNGFPPATGVLFAEPTPAALADAVRRFEAMTFDTDALVAAARPFRRERFLQEMRREVDAVLAGDRSAEVAA
ncbi:MAG TPA: glycosyltransferase [Longimicrobiales bacterium]